MRRLFHTGIHGVLFVLFPHQEHLVEPVRKALNYYTHMGKTMEEELKKEQVKKHSREENEKVTKFSFPTDKNLPSNVVILAVKNYSNFKLCRQAT